MPHVAFKSLFLIANLALAPELLAAGDAYVPGASSRGGDMLTPDQVQTTGISSKPTNDSGLYLGLGGSFGQGRTTDASSTPGVAFLGHVEPGYQVSTGSWSRLEFGLDLFAGKLDYRLGDGNQLGGKVTYPGLYGAMAKVGYGYSLGDNLFGVLKVGVGPAFSKIEIAAANGSSYKSDSLSGLAWTIAWDGVAPINRMLDFIFGVSWTQVQFDVNKVKTSGTSITVDRTLIANVPAVDLGLRLRF